MSRQEPAKHEPLLSCIYYDGLDIVALACQSKIQILLASNFTRIQILSASAEISSLQWCSTTGRLASACQHTISLHRPVKTKRNTQSGSTHTQWELFASWECKSAVSLLSWPQLGGDFLLSADRSVTVWQPDLSTAQESITRWNATWTTRMQHGCIAAKCSLDGTTFATLADTNSLDDAQVVVWMKPRSKSSDFDAHPLPHDAAVQELHWRHNTSSNQKALFTVSADRLVRIWTQLASSHEFCTQCVLELKGLSGVNMAQPSMGLGNTLMWVGRQRCNVNEDRIPSFAKNMCHERVDWLAGIHSNGNLIVWCVAGLNHAHQSRPHMELRPLHLCPVWCVPSRNAVIEN